MKPCRKLLTRDLASLSPFMFVDVLLACSVGYTAKQLCNVLPKEDTLKHRLPKERDLGRCF